MNKTNFKVLAMATFMLLFGCAYLNAQVTVGANSAPKATLDVVLDGSSSTTLAGVIAPRVSREYLNNEDGNYGSDQTGAIVYVNELNGDAIDKAGNVNAMGYYFFDGLSWQHLGQGARSFTFFAGNSGSEITNDYTVSASETFLLFDVAAYAMVTLPDDVPNGHLIYMAQKGYGSVAFTPALVVGIGCQSLLGASTGILMKTPIGWMMVTGF